MADRYWVGGSGTWNTTNTANWSTISGGSGGASVPTSSDSTFFDSTATVTISGTVVCKDLIVFTTNTTFAGTSTPRIQTHGLVDISLVTTGTAFTTISWQFLGTSVSEVLVTGGKTIGSCIVDRPSGGLTLNDAVTLASNTAITITSGTFTTNNYNVTASRLSSSNTNTRTISLGSSTVTLTTASSSAVDFGTNTNLTFNAGTSTIVISGAAAGINSGSGVTFYNVSLTSTAISTPSFFGSGTFNNFSVTGRTSAGIAQLSFDSNQTINGTLTLSAGTNATMRTFVRSDTIGATRTLTCAAVASLTDIDFRDITIAGAAAPVSGTRLGDCKGNSGITFDAAKTVYWNLAGSNNWSATAWAPSLGGTAAITNFPLAQDTAVFGAASPGIGANTTINAAYNIGTIDMSARTSNTMTLSCGVTPVIYGNWINGTGITLSGTGSFIFSGRGSQTITSAGRSFTQSITTNTPGGYVTLVDALTITSTGFGLQAGTFVSSNYNITAGNATVFTALTKTLDLGSSTLTLTSSGTVWNYTGSNLTLIGTGTISMTSALSKAFVGSGLQTYPTINQGGAGTLTVTGSNKFADLTNTANGRIQFTGGTTNEFTSFSINGTAGNLLQLGSTNTTQAILKKSTAWNVGANSTDGGNNTGLSFTAGGNDYLSISYINGQVVTPAVSGTGNFLMFFN